MADEIAIDDFSDADGTALASKALDTGGTWTLHGSYAGATAEVRGGRMRRSNTTNGCWYASVASGTSWLELEAEFTPVSLVANALGVCGYVNSAANSLYLAHYSPGSAAWLIGGFDSGSALTMFGTPTSLATLVAGNTYRLVLRLYPGQQELWVEDVTGAGELTLLCKTFDTTLPGGGQSTRYHGIRGVGSTSETTSNGLRFDEFEVRPLASTETDLTKLDLFVSPDFGGSGTGLGARIDYARLPAMASSGGYLHVFCEGRVGSSTDTTESTVVYWRFDPADWASGATPTVLTDTLFPLDPETDGWRYSNPVPIAVESGAYAGRLILLVARKPSGYAETAVPEGLTDPTGTMWVTWSDDDGVTWQPPTNITSQVKGAGWGLISGGPGRGIQLANGKCGVGVWHVDNDGPVYGSEWCDCDPSDPTDWTRRGALQSGWGNESSHCQLSDGTLWAFARQDAAGGAGALTRVTSSDNGATYGSPATITDIQQPVVYCPVLAYQDKILVGYPHSRNTSLRSKLTVTVASEDESDWTEPKEGLVNELGSGYSSLCPDPEGNGVFVCFERGSGGASSIEKLTLTRLSNAWLGLPDVATQDRRRKYRRWGLLQARLPKWVRRHGR